MEIELCWRYEWVRVCVCVAPMYASVLSDVYLWIPLYILLLPALYTLN